MTNPHTIAGVLDAEHVARFDDFVLRIDRIVQGDGLSVTGQATAIAMLVGLNVELLHAVREHLREAAAAARKAAQ